MLLMRQTIEFLPRPDLQQAKGNSVETRLANATVGVDEGTDTAQVLN